MNITIKNEKNKNNLIKILSEENVNFSITENTVDIDYKHDYIGKQELFVSPDGRVLNRIRTWNIYIIEELYRD